MWGLTAVSPHYIHTISSSMTVAFDPTSATLASSLRKTRYLSRELATRHVHSNTDPGISLAWAMPFGLEEGSCFCPHMIVICKHNEIYIVNFILFGADTGDGSQFRHRDGVPRVHAHAVPVAAARLQHLIMIMSVEQIQMRNVDFFAPRALLPPCGLPHHTLICST